MTPSEIQGELSPVFKKTSQWDDQRFYECHLDIGTAGSTGLALQAILPFILFTKLPTSATVYLRVSGGTNVSNSPSYEYIKHVLLPTLAQIGFPNIKAVLAKRGWSQGGASIGSFTLEIPPRPEVVLPAFKLTPSEPALQPSQPTNLHAIFIAPTSCHEHFRKTLLPVVAQHFGDSVLSDIGSRTNKTLTIECENSQHDKRMYFILIATFSSGYTLARDYLYERKISSHQRATTESISKVCKDLASEWRSGAWVDEHMRDQLIIFQALAKGSAEVFPGWEGEHELREPSLHARTAEWVAKQVLGVKFDAEGKCEGVGYGDEEKSSDAGGVVEKLLGLDVDDE